MKRTKSAASRSIKLDVRAEDADGKLYNIEIQRSDRGAGAKRARFHSSALDGGMLDKSQDFSELADTYVIFFTEKDTFGAGIAMYHVERKIEELDNRYLFWRRLAHNIHKRSLSRHKHADRQADTRLLLRQGG